MDDEMKKTKIIKGEETNWYGYTIDGDIYVNIQLLWEDYPREDWFIKEFGDTYTHELLHKLIDEYCVEIRLFKEEEIVRKMLGERWNKEIQKQYR